MTEKELAKFSRENKKRAWKTFYSEGNGEPLKGHCLHHKDPSWKTEDPERYAEWRPEDLVMMTNSDHTRLHRKDKHWSDEIKKRISEKQKGVPRGPQSAEHRAKISASNKGKPHRPKKNS